MRGESRGTPGSRGDIHQVQAGLGISGRQRGGRLRGGGLLQWPEGPSTMEWPSQKVVSLSGLDIQGCQRAFSCGEGWTTWPTCHPSLVLVQQGEGEGDALWAGLGPGSTGGTGSTGGGVLRDTKDPLHHCKQQPPCSEGDKAVSHVGAPRTRTAHPMPSTGLGGLPWTEDNGCHL